MENCQAVVLIIDTGEVLPAPLLETNHEALLVVLGYLSVLGRMRGLIAKLVLPWRNAYENLCSAID